MYFYKLVSPHYFEIWFYFYKRIYYKNVKLVKNKISLCDLPENGME